MNGVSTLPYRILRDSGLHGYFRFLYAVHNHLTPQHGQDPNNPADHIIGAWGECVVAHSLNIFWPTDEGPDRKQADVGAFHVRTARHPTDHLIIHDDDHDDCPFVLVVCIGLPRFRIVGWRYGHEGKRPEYRHEPNDRVTKQPNGRPAFFLPQHALIPVDSYPTPHLRNCPAASGRPASPSHRERPADPWAP